MTWLLSPLHSWMGCARPLSTFPLVAQVGVNLQVKVLRQQKQFTLDVVTGDLSDRVDGRK